jgi:hypothetical protein
LQHDECENERVYSRRPSTPFSLLCFTLCHFRVSATTGLLHLHSVCPAKPCGICCFWGWTHSRSFVHQSNQESAALVRKQFLCSCSLRFSLIAPMVTATICDHRHHALNLSSAAAVRAVSDTVDCTPGLPSVGGSYLAIPLLSPSARPAGVPLDCLRDSP